MGGKVNLKTGGRLRVEERVQYNVYCNYMASFRLARDLLESFDNGEISRDEFLLLYDLNKSKNPDSAI